VAGLCRPRGHLASATSGRAGTLHARAAAAGLAAVAAHSAQPGGWGGAGRRADRPGAAARSKRSSKKASSQPHSARAAAPPEHDPSLPVRLHADRETDRQTGPLRPAPAPGRVPFSQFGGGTFEAHD
jgi:hypothetical protein